MPRNRALSLSALFVALPGGGRVPDGATRAVKARPSANNVPRELEKTYLPDYRVEPPDILLIEAVKAVPKPPYRVEPLDVLFVQVTHRQQTNRSPGRTPWSRTGRSRSR